MQLSGEWTIHTLEVCRRAVAAVQPVGNGSAGIDLAGVQKLDTAGALQINLLRRRLGVAGGAADDSVFQASDSQKALLAIATVPEDLSLRNAVQEPAVLLWLEQLGKNVCGLKNMAQAALGFLGLSVATCGRTFLHPGRIKFTSTVYHMEQTGLRAVPIVVLLSFLIGLVIAYMAAAQLAYFGAQIFVVKLLEVVSLREMGPLITAILVAGRSGSSFTAQIGAMVANEEVDAMRSMGIDPMNVLVLPRLFALLLMLPALVLLADVMALVGGLVAVWVTMNIMPQMFLHTLQNGMHTGNLIAGLVKAPFFAVVIALIGCFRGFQVTGSADSVGRLTTRSVVESIFLVIVLDAAFALLYNAMGV